MQLQFELFHSMSEIDERAFLAIYAESSAQNAGEWYPECPFEEALKKYEDGFLAYMREAFWEEKGMLALLSCDGSYVSALRIYQKDKALFLLEALETRPDCRQRGFGAEIIRRTISALEERCGKIELLSYTGKGNVASQHTHLAAGMQKIRDYWEDEQVERDDTQVTFFYKTA